MSKVAGRIFFFLLAVIFFVWGGYHIIRYTNESMELETVFQETIPRTLTGRGIAIREEIPLDGVDNRSLHFLFKDATKVGIGQTVVEYYSGSVKSRSIQDIRDIEDEIQMLESAQNKNINNFSSAPIISRDIREQLAILSQVSFTGNCDSLSNIENELSLLVNRRHIATGKGDSFTDRISVLKSQLSELKQGSDLDNIQKGTAPISGFIAKSNDGMEQRLTPDSVEKLGINDYLKLIGDDSVGGHYQQGRIVISTKWYFAVCLPSYQTEWVNVGQNAQLSFNQFSGNVPAKVVDIIEENNNNTAVIILSSEQMSEDIINLRISDVTLIFSQFTGLKINSSSIRFMENAEGEMERGVYVLENHVVKFKSLDVIYEETSFVLSKMNYANSDNKNRVRLFDQIIVKGGTDIHDGKIIQ